ncbi:tyrosine-type recombinase/integrase [Mesorhizobium sp. M0644]|uniref:tyrosine-type recombinase/integrase n=1 Tax=Mesorhizobium sp. M0644 TaxID=2956979 RepID=UPI0033377F10
MGRQTAKTYIKYRKGSKVPEYDRDVPADIRDIVGKAKWKKSLRSYSHDDALAEARRLASEHDKIIAAARDKTPLPSQPLGSDAVALKWFNRRAIESAWLLQEARSMREFVASDGPSDEIPDPDWAASHTAALDAERHQINHQLARDAVNFKAQGTTPAALRKSRLYAAADVIEANPRDRDRITLSGVLEEWKTASMATATEQYEYPVKLFEELHGALPVKDITAVHVLEFRNALMKMPPASGGKFDGMTMQQIVQKAEAEGLKPLKASTSSKHFRCLKTIFAFALEDLFVTADVAAGIRFRGAKGKHAEAKKQKRRTFHPNEMKKLFAGAETHKWHDAKENLWFLRLLTYTGARPEELAQLSSGDLVKSGGHLCLDIHDLGDNHSKNESSIRRVPVHPELLRLGFEEFVKAAGNQPYLFSTLKRDGRGRLYSAMQRRLSALIDGKVSKDPRLVPYSLRHGFKDALRLVPGYDREVAEMIMGHSNPRHQTGRGYGTEQIVVMAELLAKADPFDKRRVVSEFDEKEDDEASASMADEEEVEGLSAEAG